MPVRKTDWIPLPVPPQGYLSLRIMAATETQIGAKQPRKMNSWSSSANEMELCLRAAFNSPPRTRPQILRPPDAPTEAMISSIESLRTGSFLRFIAIETFASAANAPPIRPQSR